MYQNVTEKIMFLGIDGMDPRLTKRFLDEGIMPNLQKLMENGSCREDLLLLNTAPTITPPLWTTLSTGALPVTHGITCFWRQHPEKLDSFVYNLDSRLCKAEALWDVTSEAGKKTLVWHWPGSSWPPTSVNDYLHVVEGTTPNGVNGGCAKLESDKMVYASTEIKEVAIKYAAINNTGAGCIIEDVPEIEVNSTIGNAVVEGKMEIANLILKHSDGEDSFEEMPIDLCNSPIKPAHGWEAAPEDAKEFQFITSNGLIHRPCLILKNEAGIYDKVAVYESKKSIEPLAILEKDVYVPIVKDVLYTKNNEKKEAARAMRVLELSEDGNIVRLWMSAALECYHDSVFWPKELCRQVMDNVGFVPSTPAFGGDNPELIDKIILPMWDYYTEWQANVLNYLIKENRYQVVFSHIHNVDGCGHMFWPRSNAVYSGEERANLFFEKMREVYKQTDRYIGKFLHLLDDEWSIMLVSDHGLITLKESDKPLIGDAFGCNVRVMEELGFTTLKKDENGNDLYEIDWEKTKATATRGGNIYINLKGKYPTGIVDPEDKYELEREIIDALYGYRFNGKRVISVAIRNKEAINLGVGGPECGDILYWLEEGFNRVHGDSLPMVEGINDTSVSAIFVGAGRGFKKNFKTERIIRQADLTPTAALMLGLRMPAQAEGGIVHQIIES